MDQEPTVDDILAKVKRFRILTVGGAGAGKSSLLNCVFKVSDASVSDYKTGKADIQTEITSPENTYFVGHDSKGFEPASRDTFKVVEEFIERRSAPNLELNERLHVVWLCINTPIAGARVIEAGQEMLLQLAHEHKIPVVVVFTQYDRVLRTKKEEEAKNILDGCVRELNDACKRLKIKEPDRPPWINVSVHSKWDAKIPNGPNIPVLTNLTRKIVGERLPGDAWIMWAMAQRRSIPLKIEASVATSINYYGQALITGSMPNIPGYGKPLLKQCLLNVHEGIVKCWNFREGEEILSNEGFKGKMLFIVQDVNLKDEPMGTSTSESQNEWIDDGVSLASLASAPIAPFPAVIGLSQNLVKRLAAVVQTNVPDTQRLLVAYTVDLTLILRKLFDLTITESDKGKPSQKALQAAVDDYKGSDSESPVRDVHAEIRSILTKWGNTFDRDTMKGSVQMLINRYSRLDSSSQSVG